MLERIISGGQTGVDRAALDVALERHLPCGGWCPAGRRAEDGRIPDRYPLTEHPDARYPARTEQNVIDADGTLILTRGALAGGTRLTAELAHRHGRPLQIVDLDDAPDPTATAAWLRGEAIRTLNVAGPRESGSPGIGELAAAYLRALLADAQNRGHR